MLYLPVHELDMFLIDSFPSTLYTPQGHCEISKHLELAFLVPTITKPIEWVFDAMVFQLVPSLDLWQIMGIALLLVVCVANRLGICVKIVPLGIFIQLLSLVLYCPVYVSLMASVYILAVVLSSPVILILISFWLLQPVFIRRVFWVPCAKIGETSYVFVNITPFYPDFLLIAYDQILDYYGKLYAEQSLFFVGLDNKGHHTTNLS